MINTETVLPYSNMSQSSESMICERLEAQQQPLSSVSYTEDTIDALTESEQSQPTFPLSDIGNTDRLVGKYGNQIVYTGKKWGFLQWTGSHWEMIDEELMVRYADKVVTSLYEEAGQIADSGKRSDYLKWIKLSEHYNKRRDMISDAKSRAEIRREASIFNKQPYLFNCANGTIDFKALTLRKPSQTDYLTTVCPTNYVKGARSPQWEHFLRKIMQGNEDLIRYLQICIGSSLIGGAFNRKLFICLGDGANGKSTLFNVISKVIGLGYSQQMSPDTVTIKNNSSSAKTDLAVLQGKRLIICSELQQGCQLDEARVKQITGGDTVVANFKYKDNFTYEPEFTIFLNTNHRPSISNQDEGIWRRVRVIPFDYRITTPITNYHESLLEDSEAILNWIVDGTRKYLNFAMTIPEPKLIQDLHTKFRTESDKVLQFLDENYVDVRNIPNLRKQCSFLTRKDLHDEFCQWCKAMSYTPYGIKKFNQEIERKGYVNKQLSNGKRTWDGLIHRRSL